MIVYWFMFISCTVLAYFSQRKCVEKTGELGETKLVPNRALVIMSAIPLVFFTGMRGYVKDTMAYIDNFEEMSTEVIERVLENPGKYKDIGFSLFTYVVKTIVDNVTVWLFIIAIICIICVWRTICKYSDSFTMSVYLYFGTASFFWLYSAMRQCIAVCVAFLLFPLVVKSDDRKKDLWRFLLFSVLIVLLSSIHVSALFVIPVFLLCRGKLFGRWHMLTIIVITVASTMIEPVEKFISDAFRDTQYKGYVTDMAMSEGGNIFRLLVACVPVFLAVYRLNAVKKMNDPIFNFCLNVSLFNACLMVPATLISGNQFARIAEYCNIFNLLLYPMALNRLYAGKIRRMLIVFLVFAYMFWFYYEIDITQRAIYHSLIFGYIG